MLEELRIGLARFLNTEIINQEFLFLNLWHVVHFASGIIVMLLIIKIFKKLMLKEKFIMLLLFLSLYEVLEFGFIAFGSGLFLGENGQDIFWDLVIGMLGGLLAVKLNKIRG